MSEQKIDGNTIKRCLSEQIGAYETDCLIYASKSFPDLDEATTINFNCGYSVFEMVYEINGEVYGVLTTAVNNKITEMIYDGQFSTDTEEVLNT